MNLSKSDANMQRHTGVFHPINRIDAQLTPWLARHSVHLVRISLGFVFLAFGVLKFFPDVSPAERMAIDAMNGLTFGVTPGSVAGGAIRG